MTKSNPAVMAALLIIGGAALRLLENSHPTILPGFTPLVALSFVAAAHLPRAWSWLVGAAAVVISEPALLAWNHASDGHFLSAGLIVSLGFYLIMGLIGRQLPERASLWALYGGPIAGSLAFYLIMNTISWRTLGYAPTFAGWVQANTTGMPGYPPVYIFLRNVLTADIVFTTLLIMILDPAREVFAHRGAKEAVQS